MRRFVSGLVRLISVNIILICVTGCVATRVNSVKDNSGIIPDHPTGLEIYLLIGQSNMAGRAQILVPDYDTLYGTFLFTGDSVQPWEPAVNPLNKYSSIRRELSIQQLSPGYYFAKTMMLLQPGNGFGLVVNARGSTSIDLWAPGTVNFNEAVKRTRQALRNGTLKAVLWHQGESDVKKYLEYPEKIVNLISALRRELQSPDLPFIAGEVAEEKVKRAEFNIMLKETLAKVPNTSVVGANDLTTYDSTHFDTRSMRILGERYARETDRLLKLSGKQHERK